MIKKEIPEFEDHERFFKFIRVIANDCWEWLGAKNQKGYGLFSINMTNIVAHRVSYKMFVKNPSLNMVIDHKCKNRSCVNPDHLREISELLNNTVYSVSPMALNGKKTHCIRGHELIGSNIWTSNKRRECKLCKALRRTKKI